MTHERNVPPISRLTRSLAASLGGANPKRALTLDESADGLTVCFANAESLLNDVRTLVSAGAWPRAAALVVLALEELAKIPDLHDTALIATVRPEEDPWPAFWRRFSEHRSKQAKIAEYGKLITAAMGGSTAWVNPGPYEHFLPDDLGRLLDIFKQRSFYVDYWDGRFVLPGSVPSDLPEFVDALYALAVERLDSFEPMHATQARSRSLLETNIAVSQGKARPSGRRVSRPSKDLAERRRDLHGLLAHRSSAGVPDYLSVYERAADLMEGLTADQIVAVAQEEAAVLVARQNDALPTAGVRGWRMFKLLVGYLDRQGLKMPDLIQ